MQKKVDFKLGELFCGPGGLALGAGLASEKNIVKDNTVFSISHVWGVDNDPSAIKTYQNNVAKRYGGDSICFDALSFCQSEIQKYKRITALAFGFPCNDFSLVGKRKGVNGDFGKLYKAGVEAINKNNPYWFIAENVSGINSANSKTTFPLILQELSQSGRHGYSLTVHMYKFEKYGVPQYRHRYIIAGIRKDKHLKFRVPAPLFRSVDEYITAEEALSNIAKDALNSELAQQKLHIVKRLQYTPPWHNAWYLEELVRMSNRQRRQELIYKLPWYRKEISEFSDYKIKSDIESSMLHCKKAKMSHIYKRLVANRPSYTITGSGGGGTHVYHWREHRSLTNRERARLQSFPDWFHFCGTKEQQRKQIGMAVPPQGAQVIFEAMLKTFAGIEYPYIDENYKVT